MKKKLLIAAPIFAFLLWGAGHGNLQWNQFRADNIHGTDAKGQSSDGTGASGNFAKFNSGGGLTDGAPPPSTVSAVSHFFLTAYNAATGAFSTAQAAFTDISGTLSLATGPFTGILPVTNGGSGTSTPSLVAGSNITISGSWPNQTVAASGGGGGGGGFSPFPSSLTVPLSANFSWLNPNSYSVTATDKSDRLLLVIPSSAFGVAFMQTAALPATPYTIDTAFSFVSGENVIVCSLVLKANASNPLRSFGPRADAVPTAYYNKQAWTSVTSPGSQIITSSTYFYPLSINFVRITDDGTTRKIYMSSNGKDYVLFDSEATNTGVTPDRCGLMFYNNNATALITVSVYHWLVSSSVLPQYAS